MTPLCLSMTPLPIQVDSWTGHRVVLHDHGEDYQPPITFRAESSQVHQGFSMTPPTHPG